MPGCYPYGVRAMWSERSRHMRGGAVLGSSGKVAGLAVRFLARDMRLTGAKAAGVPAALAPVSLMSRARIHTAAPHNRSSTLGHPRVPGQIVQARLKVDARLDPPALMCATLAIRLSLTASSPHSDPGHADRNPTD